ncbi:MAG: polysaccharide deacetylase family protein [Elusimicrobiota bacterium]|nr:polysaccharide deacetylase family protein [Elusimicrobiota bacterium]
MPVLILCYHTINKNGKITPEIFEENLFSLKKKNYSPASLDDIFNYISGKKELLGRTVHLTFDDGYRDNYSEAFPILKKFNFKATVFLITSRVGMLGYLQWQQIKEMESSGIFSFESHSHTHPRHSTTQSTKEELINDLLISKKIIKENLKKETKHFCYPYGEYDNLYVSALKEAGFLTGLTLNIGLNAVGQNPYLLKRIEVRNPKNWLGNRLRIYSKPFISNIYEKIYRKI